MRAIRKGDQVWERLDHNERGKVIAVITDEPNWGIPILVEKATGKRNYAHEELERIPEYDQLKEFVASFTPTTP